MFVQVAAPRSPQQARFRRASASRHHNARHLRGLASSSPSPFRKVRNVAVAVVAAGALGWTLAHYTPHWLALAERSTTLTAPEPAPSTPLTPPSSLTAEEQATVQLFERNRDSVVLVTTLIERRDLTSLNILEIPAGNGSGFVWDTQGHVVTNFHVVRNAEAARVTMADGQSYSAKLVGYDADKDIAVLRIEAPRDRLRPIVVGTSSNVKVGQRAYAIGNPFGLNETLTQGIVSGLGREIPSPSGRPISNVLQTDSAINPGNSGGPLLDSSGRLIGMTTAIYSPSGASAGVGFAIPVDTLKTVVETLIKFGKVTRPVIGISYLESNQAQFLGIKEGVLVLEVPPNSEAAKAGLRGTRRTFGQLELGDIIVGMDGERVRNEADLFRILEQKKPGQRVKLEVIRGPDMQKRVQLTVQLSSSQ